MWRGKRHSRSGFTLLEIMVSLAILSIALVTLLSANNKALAMIAESESMTDAVTLAREEMEKLYIEPTPEAGVSDKKSSEDYPRFKWRVEIVETPFEGVMEARVKVFEAGDEKETPVFSLKAYITKKAAL